MTKITRRGFLAAMAAAVPLAAQKKAWRPKLGVLGNFTQANLDFAKQDGFTSIGLWANPKTSLDVDAIDDATAARVRDSVRNSGLYLSVVGTTQNHIAPDPEARSRANAYTIKVIELAGKLGAPYIGTASGNIPGKKLAEQVSEIVRVYQEKYFPVCEKSRVRILWEPWPDGPNIATGAVGYEALFKAFGDSPYVGLQYDPSHLVRQWMDPIQTARDFVDKIYDVHLKDTEIFWHVLRRAGIRPVNGAQWWRYRLPGLGSIDWPAFFTVLMDAGYTGAMNIEHEDPTYGWPNRGDDFSEDYKAGFRVAHRYLRQYVPQAT